MTKTVETLDWEDFKRLWEDGTNPFTGEVDEELQGQFKEAIKYNWRDEVTPVGTFAHVANWSYGDGHEQGNVVKHVETGTYLRISGVYSSWDSSQWNELAEVRPYEKTVVRYQTVKDRVLPLDYVY